MTFSKKSVLSVSLFVLILWGAVLSTFANPPTSPYGVSQNITDPACPPGGTNCYVASVSIGDTIGNNPDQNGILYTDASGQITTDDLFTRDSVTKETNIFRDASVNVQTGEYIVNAYTILLVQVFGPGSFTVGETITGQNSGATAVVGGYVLGGSGNLLYVSNISGTFIEGEEITSTYPGTVMVDEEILPSSFAVGDAFMEFDYPSGPTGVTGSVTAVSGDSITVNVTGGSLTPSNILFNTTQNNNYRGIVSAQPVTVSGTAHTGFTLSNIAIGTPFSGSGMYSELNGNKLFAGIVNGYQFGIFSEISGTPSGYYLPTTAGTTGQALISLGGNTVGWGTLPSAISVNNDGTLYSGTLGAGEGDRDNIFLGSYAGEDATNASYSNFFGQQAGQNATNAYQSNFLGSYAGINATNASNSNFLGYSAGYSATGAYNSNFLGSFAGYSATSASYSNFLGQNAGAGATSASNSIFIGKSAGNNDLVNNTGSLNDFSILIGPNTSTGNNGSGVGYSNSIALGGYATNTASNQFMIGSTTRPINDLTIVGTGFASCTIDIPGGTDAGGGTGTGISCSSDERLKTNIENLESTTLDTLLNVKTVRYNWNANPTGNKSIGFLAQDLQQYFPELVKTGHDGYLQVNYAGITPILVEAIREMNLNVTQIADMTRENTWRDVLISWLGNASNKITRIFTGELCLYDENGQIECINALELRALKQSQNIQTTPEVLPPTVDTSLEDTPPPTEESPTDDPSIDESSIEEPPAVEPSPEVPPPTVDTPTVDTPPQTGTE